MPDQKLQTEPQTRLLGASSRMNEDRGPEPYPCPICSAQFRYAEDLERHLESEHPGVREIS